MPKGRIRDYNKEYRDFHKKPEQKKRRAARNKDRRQALREGRVRLGDNKDIDHKDGNPTNHSSSNKRIQNRSVNRARQPNRLKGK